MEVMIILDHPCYGWDLWRPQDEAEAELMRKQGYVPISELRTLQAEVERLKSEVSKWRAGLYDKNGYELGVSISKGEGHMDENLIGRIIERLQALQAQHGDLPVTVRIDMDWGGSTDIPVGSIEFCEADEIEKMVLPNRIVILLD
jgi:hypothetical protein